VKPVAVVTNGRAVMAEGVDRAFWAMLVLGVVVILPFGAFYWPASHGLDVTGHQIGRDFINVWSGPQLAFGGRLLTLFDLSAYHDAIGDLFGRPLPFHNWSYPPFTLALFWPLSLAPYFIALALWTVGLFAAFGALALAPVGRADRGLALLFTVLAPATLVNVVCGQNGFLTAVLFVGGVLAIDRRPVLAGVLIGLLSYKPHFGLVLPFALLALGAWRVIWVAALTVLVLVAVSLLLFGTEPWHHYLVTTRAYQLRLLEQFQGFYMLMMVSGLAGFRTLGVPFQIASALQIALALAVTVLACWAVRRTANPYRRAFILVNAALLATPYAFNYDLPALAIMLVWRQFGVLGSDSRWRPVALLAWLSPALVMLTSAAGVALMPFVLLATFVMSIREAERDDRADAGAPTGSRSQAGAPCTVG
jgi:Glycosyltransferase family 87